MVKCSAASRRDAERVGVWSVAPSRRNGRMKAVWSGSETGGAIEQRYARCAGVLQCESPEPDELGAVSSTAIQPSLSGCHGTSLLSASYQGNWRPASPTKPGFSGALF